MERKSEFCATKTWKYFENFKPNTFHNNTYDDRLQYNAQTT